MLIKTVTKKGDAVTFSPSEALPVALEYAVKSQNTVDKVYWMDRSGVVIESASNLPDNKGGYTAQAAGTLMMGYTDAKTDRFFEPKKYTFAIKYHNSKDSIGLPDVDIDEAKFVLVEMNPSKLMGFPEAVVAQQIVAKKVAAKVAEKPAE